MELKFIIKNLPNHYPYKFNKKTTTLVHKDKYIVFNKKDIKMMLILCFYCLLYCLL